MTLCALQTTSQSILDDARRQLGHAQSITLTEIQTTEEFQGGGATKIWWRKGGFLRTEQGAMTDIATPTQGWTLHYPQRVYVPHVGLATDFTLDSVVSFDAASGKFPIIGKPKAMKWHGMQTVRVELDGRSMTKETKLFMFFDPKKHLPLGLSANLGSVTQVRVYKDLKIDPKIDNSIFQFTPPKGWKRSGPPGSLQPL